MRDHSGRGALSPVPWIIDVWDLGRCSLNPSCLLVAPIALTKASGLPGDVEGSTLWHIRAFRGQGTHTCYGPELPLLCSLGLPVILPLCMESLAGATHNHQVLYNMRLSAPWPWLEAVASGPVPVCTFGSSNPILGT